MGRVQSVGVELKKGRLPIKLEYFQNVFGYGLYVAWSGPGFEKRNLSAPADAGTGVADINELIRKNGARVLGGCVCYDEWQKLNKQINFLRKPPPPTRRRRLWAAVRLGSRHEVRPDTFVMVRGSPHVLGDKGRTRLPGACSNCPIRRFQNPRRASIHRAAAPCWRTGSSRPTTR